MTTAADGTVEQPDILAMSDEDFSKLEAPPVVSETPETPPAVVETETPEVTTPVTTPTEVENGGNVADNATEQVQPAAPAATAEIPAKGQGEQKEIPKDDKTPPSGSDTEVVAADTPTDYESIYKKIMTPFKANGKMIELKSPEEAIQLMQQGANYTKKMQDLVPHRKVLLMLENNGLLDEGKLSFLIDIEKKNPEAIKKLLKDSGIDPLDIDTSTESAYREGNHKVTDEETVFRSVLDEVGSTPEGKETLQIVNTQWDQASKDKLWTDPKILTVMHTQRENGIYDRIVSELDRQKTLGAIPPGVSFLDAYKVVGDYLRSQNGFADLAPTQPAAAPKLAPTVVATSVAAPKGIPNGARAAAASPTRSTPQIAKVLSNPLALSDEEFMNQWQKRL